MRKKGKVLSVMFAATLAATVLAGCGSSSASSSDTSAAEDTSATEESSTDSSSSSDAEYVIKIGNTATYPSQPNVWMREFKEAIESATDQITVELYEASSYGDPDAMIQGLQSGEMTAVCIPVGFYASAATASEVLDMPFLFEDPEEYYYVMNSGNTDLYTEYMETKGLVPVTWLLESNRDIYTNTKIETIDDFNGLQIRTYSSSISQAEINAYGASPIIMGTSDVPLALQQGTIDAIQCGNTLAAPGKYYDVTTYALVNAGTAVPIPVMFSKDFLDSLPDDLYELVIDTAKSINYDSNFEYTQQYIEDCYDEIEAGGVELVEASDELIADMKAATESVEEEFLEANPDIADAYQQILDTIDEYEANGTLELDR